MAAEIDHPAPPAFFDDLPRLRPGRHKLPASEVARSQRERLMAGMLAAVGEKGYISTTVADALVRAGVSRRTFYEHFSDKEDCYLRAFEHVVARARVAVGEAVAAERDWRSGLRTGLGLLLRAVAANPRYARACLVEILALGADGVRRRELALEPFVRSLQAGRAEGPDGARIPPTAAEVVVGGIVETVVARLVRDEADRLPELLDELVFLALVPFLGREAAARASG